MIVALTAMEPGGDATTTKAKSTNDSERVSTVLYAPKAGETGNLYSDVADGKLNPAVKDMPAKVYVPALRSNEVYVIDPVERRVVDRFVVGAGPQHVVPGWDLSVLWVTNNAEGTTNGSLTPINPLTGKGGNPVPVEDPYNMYFTADGSSAIVVAEALKRLDFRDPHTMQLQQSVSAPECAGINHADFSVDGRYAIFTCEFQGSLVKVDIARKEVSGYLKLPENAMPQDIRISPDGKSFYIADLKRGGVYTVAGDEFQVTGFIPTGIGTHSLTPSRDGKHLYVANRGIDRIGGPVRGKGSVSVIEFATDRVVADWSIPGGGSPDMGNISVDGKTLWLSGRYDNVVYAIDTTSGSVTTIPVGSEPHGLTVWPQPGKYSLGHTGNMRGSADFGQIGGPLARFQ